MGRTAPAYGLLKEDFLHREELPYSRAGLLMEKSSGYVKIVVRMGLTFLWNKDSALVSTFTQFPTGLRNSI